MHRRERVTSFVEQNDAEAFARELNLDPVRTREWFDQGFTQEGYGAEVIKALGTHMLKVLTGTRNKGDADGGPNPRTTR